MNYIFNVGQSAEAIDAVQALLKASGRPVLKSTDVCKRKALYQEVSVRSTPTEAKFATTEYYKSAERTYSNYVIVDLRQVPKEVKITSDYTAVVAVDKKTVKVGCQTITKEKIEEVYKLLQ